MVDEHARNKININNDNISNSNMQNNLNPNSSLDISYSLYLLNFDPIGGYTNTDDLHQSGVFCSHAGVRATYGSELIITSNVKDGKPDLYLNNILSGHI